jgi:hypothetical protein
VAVCCGRALAALKVAFDGVKNAVYELSCFKGREATSYLEGLVYYDCLWGIAFVQELVNRKSKDVTIYDRHTLDTPVFCATLYQIIDFIETRNRAKREVVGEFASHIAHIVAERLPVTVSQFVNARLSNVVLKEHL